jgi:hypothetical protein
VDTQINHPEHPMHPATHAMADSTRTYLELNRLLDEIEPRHPEISAPLRLTLIRAHRNSQVVWLDPQRFRNVVDDLLLHARSATACPTTV